MGKVKFSPRKKIEKMAPERKRHLILSSLRQRAVFEANMHYGGDLKQGIAGELSRLANEVEEKWPSL